MSVRVERRWGLSGVRLPWFWPYAAFAALNLGLILYNVRLTPDTDDWKMWLQLRSNLDNPYEVGWVWSPFMAWIMVGVTHIGYWPWLVLHIAVVPLLRDRRLIFLTLVSWPFWSDASFGNTFTFVFVAGVLACRNSRLGAVASLVLLMLMPRPIQIPLAALILWRHPSLRLPFLAAVFIHGAGVISLRLLGPWIDSLLALESAYNISPAAFIGRWWLLIGIPLALWLTIRAKPGWAGLATSPYILPQYLLVLLWEVAGRGRRQE